MVSLTMPGDREAELGKDAFLLWLWQPKGCLTLIQLVYSFHFCCAFKGWQNSFPVTFLLNEFPSLAKLTSSTITFQQMSLIIRVAATEE